MRMIRIFLLCLLSVSAWPTYADQAAVTRLTELLGKVETLNGRFSQLTLDGSGTNLQENAGEMYLKRPGLFRWHTDAPMEQLLVSDGKQVWLYDPDLEQVTVRALDQRLTHTPALLLSGDVSEISKSFDISFKESSGVVDFELKPKARDTLFDSLRMSFRQGVINDMQLIDSAGQRTNILFSGVKLNAAVKPSLFTFEVPKGADVIQE
jgi:outer membrane lipoprotein carrier protein